MAQEAHTTPYILYKCACTIPDTMFYDAKLQSVKTPVAAKPRGISPNHPCQCPLVIKTQGSESWGQEEAGLHNEPVRYLQVAPL